MIPFRPAAERLQTIPGVGQRAAEVLLAEIGPDMSVFSTPDYLSSWAGVSRGNNEVPANAGAAALTQGAIGCVRCWCKPLGRPGTP